MISAIVMASGFSKRMKKNKLLLEIEDKTIIEKMVEEIKKTKVDEIIVVYKDKEVFEKLDKYNIKTIYNENSFKGQSESMKLGIKNASFKSSAYMFLVADQPLLDKDTINRLIDEFNKTKKLITVPIYKDKRGIPVIFPVKYKDELLKVTGDKGGREIIKKNKENTKFVFVEEEKKGLDIDDIKDYKKIIEIMKQ